MNEHKKTGMEDQDVEDLDELNEIISAAYSITSYGADYPVDGLVKRMGQGDIVVPLFSLEPARELGVPRNKLYKWREELKATDQKGQTRLVEKSLKEQMSVRPKDLVANGLTPAADAFA